MKKIIQQSGFSFGWKPLKTKIKKPTKDGFYPPRDWQKDAFELLKDEQYSIVNAPMGSGKTWLMCLLAAHKMRQNKKLKTLIAVPQTIIGDGFSEAKLLMPDKSKLHWFAQHNLCQESPTEGTIRYVINWLKNPIGFFQDGILICTHATLVAVYKELKETNQLNLLKNLNLWIDEAHHLQNAEIEGFDDSVISNGIGELVHYIVRYVKSSHVGLATATFFRGNRLSLLSLKMESKFVRFNLPYDKYLGSMEHLKSFSFDFVLCGPKYHKAIDKILKKSGKDIIYIPHPISRYSTGKKYKEVEDIVVHYRKKHKGKKKDLDNGLTVVQKKRGNFKIIDLVDEDRRKEKKKYIREITKRSDLDSIIALGMFKEGANWIWADRSIIVGPRTSLVDVIQMIGRLFRDAPGKKHVQVIQLLPFSLDHTDEVKLRENLNSYLKAIYASLILENIFNPVQIMAPNGAKKPHKKGERTDWLGQVLPDDAQQLSLIEDVSSKLMEIADTNKEAGDVTVLWDEYCAILPDILSEYGIKEHVELVGRQIWSIFARKTLQMQGVNVDDIDFEILKKTNPLDGLLGYTSGACDIQTLENLRIACNQEEQLKQQAIDYTNEVCDWINQYGSLPSQINDRSRFLGLKLSRLRMAKNGNGYRTKWYPECDTIALERGCPELFYSDLERVSSRVKEICDWITLHRKRPNGKSTDKKEKELAQKIQNIKKNKKYIHIIHKMADKMGHPNLFLSSNEKDRENDAIEWTEKICEFVIENGKYPSPDSAKIQEKQLAVKLNTLRQAKNGGVSWNWYPSLIGVAQRKGCPDLFEQKNCEQEAIRWVNKICDWMDVKDNNSLTGQYDHKKLQQKLTDFRKSHQGKGTTKIYPILYTIASNRGYPDLFDTCNLEQKHCDTLTRILRESSVRGRLPTRSKEPRDHQWLENMRHAKSRDKNKKLSGRRKWYPSLDKIAKEMGYSSIFNRKQK